MKQTNKVKLTMSDWDNGIWGNRHHYFDSIEGAKRKLREEKRGRRLKIYNGKGHLIHSEDDFPGNVGHDDYGD